MEFEGELLQHSGLAFNYFCLYYSLLRWPWARHPTWALTSSTTNKGFGPSALQCLLFPMILQGMPLLLHSYERSRKQVLIPCNNDALHFALVWHLLLWQNTQHKLKRMNYLLWLRVSESIFIGSVDSGSVEAEACGGNYWTHGRQEAEKGKQEGARPPSSK
jgi:hypothetical protein